MFSGLSYSLARALTVAIVLTSASVASAQEAWITRSSGGVVRIDTTTDTQIAGATALPAGNAYGVLATPGITYVANYDADSVSVIDTATTALVTEISVGSMPFGLAISPDGKLLAVANSGGNTVSVIDTATNSVIRNLTSFPNPTGVAISPDGTTVYIANRSGGLIARNIQMT